MWCKSGKSQLHFLISVTIASMELSLILWYFFPSIVCSFVSFVSPFTSHLFHYLPIRFLIAFKNVQYFRLVFQTTQCLNSRETVGSKKLFDRPIRYPFAWALLTPVVRPPPTLPLTPLITHLSHLCSNTTQNSFFKFFYFLVPIIFFAKLFWTFHLIL